MQRKETCFSFVYHCDCRFSAVQSGKSTSSQRRHTFTLHLHLHFSLFNHGSPVNLLRLLCRGPLFLYYSSLMLTLYCFLYFYCRDSFARLTLIPYTSGVSGQAVQPIPLASLKLSIAVYGQKLDGRPSR